MLQKTRKVLKKDAERADQNLEWEMNDTCICPPVVIGTLVLTPTFFRIFFSFTFSAFLS